MANSHGKAVFALVVCALSAAALNGQKAKTTKRPAIRPAPVANSTTPAKPKPPRLWSLQPVVRPPVPPGVTDSTNPIDAFIADEYQKQGLKPVAMADKRTLLRRVYLDLIGIPPTPAEQDAFVEDTAPDAWEKVVDRLLASEQYGVRYGRHWLDVLRYADNEERMYAAPGIHLWRDWVINALNSDTPYDDFVRAQLTGYRKMERTQMTAVGRRMPLEPRPDDMFALGFLSRGAVSRDAKDLGELQISAVETVSTAFLGMTVGCAKCHDHMFDPIKQRDFYAMKALFDPLVIKKVNLAGPADMMAHGKALEAFEKKRAGLEAPVNELIAPYKKKLYDDRVAMLPAEVRTVILKPEKERTAAEQKIADDYYPVLRIDPDKIEEVLPPDDLKKYKELRSKLNQLSGGRRGSVPELPAFWTVQVDHALEKKKNYILASGDPERPEKDKPVEPGWPFAPEKIDFRDGRVEAFSDWLTAPENPLFARVAINRLWQWHFGEGLHKTPSDFGVLGGKPANPALLDWLAAEFVARKYSMKQMHRLMVTSRAYKLASYGDAELISANRKADPNNRYLWSFRLQRLDAEGVWDSILSAAGNLDLTVGGPSFDIENRGGGRRGGGGPPVAMAEDGKTNRRGAYIVRGFSTSRDIVPNFLQVFDVDDGRVSCPVRTQTVTAPQALFLMNNDEIEKASAKFAERLQNESNGDLSKAVDLGYRISLARPATPRDKDQALTYLNNDPSRLKGFGWMLFNLDEFVYVQ